jgi:hypothetical protein
MLKKGDVCKQTEVPTNDPKMDGSDLILCLKEYFLIFHSQDYCDTKCELSTGTSRMKERKKNPHGAT